MITQFDKTTKEKSDIFANSLHEDNDLGVKTRHPNTRFAYTQGRNSVRASLEIAERALDGITKQGNGGRGGTVVVTTETLRAIAKSALAQIKSNGDYTGEEK